MIRAKAKFRWTTSIPTGLTVFISHLTMKTAREACSLSMPIHTAYQSPILAMRCSSSPSYGCSSTLRAVIANYWRVLCSRREPWWQHSSSAWAIYRHCMQNLQLAISKMLYCQRKLQRSLASFIFSTTTASVRYRPLPSISARRYMEPGAIRDWLQNRYSLVGYSMEILGQTSLSSRSRAEKWNQRWICLTMLRSILSSIVRWVAIPSDSMFRNTTMVSRTSSISKPPISMARYKSSWSCEKVSHWKFFLTPSPRTWKLPRIILPSRRVPPPGFHRWISCHRP